MLLIIFAHFEKLQKLSRKASLRLLKQLWTTASFIKLQNSLRHFKAHSLHLAGLIVLFTRDALLSFIENFNLRNVAKRGSMIDLDTIWSNIFPSSMEQLSYLNLNFNSLLQTVIINHYCCYNAMQKDSLELF